MKFKLNKKRRIRLTKTKDVGACLSLLPHLKNVDWKEAGRQCAENLKKAFKNDCLKIKQRRVLTTTNFLLRFNRE